MSEGYDGLPPYYVQSSDPLTPNLGLSLKGMDPIVAENFVLIDDFAGTGGGGTPSPPDMSVQFNTAGSFGGSANFFWDNTNTYLGIGANATQPGAGSGILGSPGIGVSLESTSSAVVAALEIHNAASGAILAYAHNDAGQIAPYLNLYKSRGTQAAPTAVTFTGYEIDSIGGINFGGWDGSSYVRGPASILTQPDENWTPTSHGAHLSIYGTQNGMALGQQIIQFGGKDPNGFYGTSIISYRSVVFSGNQSQYVGLFPTAGSPTAILSIRKGDNSADAPLTASQINASVGFQIAGTAPSNHILLGNGTNYVDSASLPTGIVLWNQLGNAAADLTLANTTFNTTFNQTSSVNWIWANVTAATSGASQSSPILNINGTYWTGAASATDAWTLQNVVANGTNGQAALSLSHTGTTGAAGLKIEGNGQSGAATNIQPLEIHNTSNGCAGFYAHVTGTNGATLNFSKSRGTEAAPTAINSADFPAFIGFRGYNGTAYVTGAQIQVQAQGNWTGSNNATSIQFNIVKVNTTAQVEAIRIGSSVDTIAAGLPLGVLTGNTLGFMPTSVNTAFDSGFSRLGAASIAVGNGTAGDFTGTLKLTIANAITGYQVNGAATSGNYLRGNGTNFVSSAIQAGDLPAGTGTVTSIATTAPLAGGTITTTGTLSITGAAGQVLAGASPAFTATPILGVNASTNGTLGLANGGGSGATITIQNLGATSAYNFNLPTTAGSGGQILTSQGGGSTSMTWSTGVPASTCVWSTLTDAAADLTLANTTFNSTFNQTTAVTWKWANITAATSGVSQSSPIKSIAGTYWTGAASASDSWTIQDIIANGTNGTSKLTFTHSGSSGAATINVPLIQANANVTAFVQSASGAAAIGFPNNSLFDINFGGTSAFRFSSAAITAFAGAATVGLGVPSEIITIDLTAQAAAITATNLVASAPRTGHYQISWSATITTAGTTSVLGGTNGFQVGYTSPTDSVAKTTVPGNSVTSAANTTGTAVGGVEVVYAKTGTAITYAYDYTSTGTAMNYELHIRLLAL